MDKSNIGKVKIIDKIRLYEKTGAIVSNCFLDPREIVEYESIYSKYEFFLSGGFDESERKILIIGESNPNISDYINLLEIKASKNISHREVLGSVLGTRNKKRNDRRHHYKRKHC